MHHTTILGWKNIAKKSGFEGEENKMELDKCIISAQEKFKEIANDLLENAYCEYDTVNEYLVYLSNTIEGIRCELDHIDDELIKYKKNIFKKTYSKEDYKNATLIGLDLDNWNDYVRYFNLGSNYLKD